MLQSKKSQYIGKACYYSVNELMNGGRMEGRMTREIEGKKQRKKKKLLIHFTIIVSFYIWSWYLDTFFISILALTCHLIKKKNLEKRPTIYP